MLTSPRTARAFDLDEGTRSVASAVRQDTLGPQPAVVAVAWSSTAARFVPDAGDLPVEEGEPAGPATGTTTASTPTCLQGLPRADAGLRPGGSCVDQRSLRPERPERDGSCSSSAASSVARRRSGHQDKATKRPGRDHWARSMSIFLSGGGLKMGQVVGATNCAGRGSHMRRVMNSNCLLSTVYRRFGVNAEHHYLRQHRSPGSDPDRWRADPRVVVVRGVT